MTKKAHRQGRVAIPIHPIVTEGPLPRDPVNVRIMRREIHRLESMLREQNGNITAFRELLINSSADEHWEVPG